VIRPPPRCAPCLHDLLAGFQHQMTPDKCDPQAVNLPPTFLLILAGSPDSELMFLESINVSYTSLRRGFEPKGLLRVFVFIIAPSDLIGFDLRHIGCIVSRWLAVFERRSTQSIEIERTKRSPCIQRSRSGRRL